MDKDQVLKLIEGLQDFQHYLRELHSNTIEEEITDIGEVQTTIDILSEYLK